MKYSGGYPSLSPVNITPALRAGIKQFSVQMATSGIANQFLRHGLQIAQCIVTYIMSSGMFVSGACFQRLNLEIMSLLSSNNTGGTPTI